MNFRKFRKFKYRPKIEVVMFGDQTSAIINPASVTTAEARLSCVQAVEKQSLMREVGIHRLAVDKSGDT
jgi:hypothetical protein